jgi:sugar lactone lactonase YvrE
MRRTLRVLAVATAATLGLTLAPAAPAAAKTDRFPSIINLPDGFRPEGIAIGAAPFAYFGSLANGDIYRANLVNGTGEIIVEGPGTPSVGLKLDHRGRLFVAGGVAGNARVIDVRTRTVLASYTFATTPPATFINDVVLTPTAAYFTDSRRAVLYKLPFGRHGKLPPADGFETINLTGGIVVDPAVNNANGISRTPDGKALIIVQSTPGLLWRVNPKTGANTQVDIGGFSVANGDGLLLIGRRLYVVLNRLNTIVVIDLNRSGTRGRVVDQITDPNFDVPTTVASFGRRLYLPNARFGIANPDDATYTAVAVRR